MPSDERAGHRCYGNCVDPSEWRKLAVLVNEMAREALALGPLVATSQKVHYPDCHIVQRIIDEFTVENLRHRGVRMTMRGVDSVPDGYTACRLCQPPGPISLPTKPKPGVTCDGPGCHNVLYVGRNRIRKRCSTECANRRQLLRYASLVPGTQVLFPPDTPATPTQKTPQP